MTWYCRGKKARPNRALNFEIVGRQARMSFFPCVIIHFDRASLSLRRPLP